MANWSLKVNHQSYEAKLNRLVGLAHQIDAQIGKYYEYRNQVDDFVGAGDRIYDNLVASINENIAACKKSYSNVQSTIELVKQTLQDMVETESRAHKSIELGREQLKVSRDAAVEGLKTAMEISALIK